MVEGAVPEDADVNVISSPRYWDYQILGRYRPAPAHELRAFLFASDDELELLFSNLADPGTAIAGNGLSADQGFYRFIFSYNFTPSERFQNRFRFLRARIEPGLTSGSCSSILTPSRPKSVTTSHIKPRLAHAELRRRSVVSTGTGQHSLAAATQRR